MKILAAILALFVFGVDEEEVTPDLATENISAEPCRTGFDFQIGQLRQGTKYYEEYLAGIERDLKRCNRKLSDLGISKNDRKEFEYKGCVAKARYEYLRGSGTDPVGERVYLKNFKSSLIKCGMAKSESEVFVCRTAKATRYRSDGFCEMIARSVK